MTFFLEPCYILTCIHRSEEPWPKDVIFFQGLIQLSRNNSINKHLPIGTYSYIQQTIIAHRSTSLQLQSRVQQSRVLTTTILFIFVTSYHSIIPGTFSRSPMDTSRCFSSLKRHPTRLRNARNTSQSVSPSLFSHILWTRTWGSTTTARLILYLF